MVKSRRKTLKGNGLLLSLFLSLTHTHTHTHPTGMKREAVTDRAGREREGGRERKQEKGHVGSGSGDA